MEHSPSSDNNETAARGAVVSAEARARNNIPRKVAVSSAIVAVSVAAYLAFGFFFDVFVEVVPLLAIPFIVVPLVAAKRTVVSGSAAIAVCTVLLVLSAAAFGAVGALAQPVKGEDICCGTTEKFTYSREFMRENYDIDQKVVIDVWLPQDYDENLSYPVVYVLDGDSLFDAAAGAASQACARGEGGVIVVGIGYGYLNPSFARGGIVWQDTEHLRGRWRDYCFADDTEAGYMPGTIMGGDTKRGKEYTDFIAETLVPDIRGRYSTDTSNSTIFGHSLGGGLAAYFSTQYDPSEGDDNAFNNFVIVDNGYLEYIVRHLEDFESAMNSAGGAAYSPVTVYRIWGGAVNPEGDDEQVRTARRIADYGFSGVSSLYYQPEGANHSDTQLIGINCAIKLALGQDVPTTPLD